MMRGRLMLHQGQMTCCLNRRQVPASFNVSQDDIPVFRCLSHGRDIHPIIRQLREPPSRRSAQGDASFRRTPLTADDHERSVVHGRRPRMRRRRVGS